MLIKKPIITEKTMALAEQLNQYTFEVTADANKQAAAQELAGLFNVTVEAVRVSNRLGKTYSFGRTRRVTRRKPSKKVMVFRLADGQKIDIFTK